MRNVSVKRVLKKCFGLVSTCSLLAISLDLYAQDGNAGINQANTQVRSYFAAGTNFNVCRWCHCRIDWSH